MIDNDSLANEMSWKPGTSVTSSVAMDSIHHTDMIINEIETVT